jgi:GTPase SAR1 family protein
MKKINEHYATQNSSRVVNANVRNIVIIGRSRTGKSSFKRILVDPREVPKDMTIFPTTNAPSIESFFIDDINLILNIMDTPGLFERSRTRGTGNNNDAILKTIEMCINLEVTKFHMICFAMVVTTGIQRDDVETLKVFIDRLGPELSQNSCLILTHAESKTPKQRLQMRQELLESADFDQIGRYFKRGIFFTGTINYDDYNKGEETIFNQYKTVLEYRKELLSEFAKDIKPIYISKSYISEIRRIREHYERRNEDLQSELTRIKNAQWCSTS